MPNIFVIDDDPTAAELFTSLLKAFGHAASFVTTGQEALASLATALPDLVLLDIMMPDMDGIDVLRAIKADQHIASVPVVMFSALDDDVSRQRAASAGAADYWIKGGFDFGELEEKVGKWMTANR